MGAGHTLGAALLPIDFVRLKHFPVLAVEAHGGEVTLKGHVRSWAERQEAERTAWLAPGVTKVDDRIAMSP